MANTATPNGLRPINLIGGQPFAGSTRMLPIASGYATSIFYGDVVKLVAASGTIQKDTGTTALTPVGVFMGCQYVDTVYGLTFRQMWTASTVPANSTLAYAFVCDDPDTVFQIQATAAVAQTALGQNAAVVQNAGDAISGDSRVSLNAATVANTNTLPLRIIGFGAGSPIINTDTYPELLVKWNWGMHQYQNASGVS